MRKPEREACLKEESKNSVLFSLNLGCQGDIKMELSMQSEVQSRDSG